MTDLRGWHNPGQEVDELQALLRSLQEANINIYAFDPATGKIVWQRHWDYPPPAGRGGGANPPPDPAHLGFLQPGGSSDTPVIGPPDAQGRRPLYFITGDGMLHILDAATGEDLQPSFMFHTQAS